MPAPKVILWQEIRRKQIGVKFRRQFSIENFILDFYCPEIKLRIEIDGDSHFISNESLRKDKLRDNILFKKYKIKILRFTNIEIRERLERCLEIIMKEINTTSNFP